MTLALPTLNEALVAHGALPLASGTFSLVLDANVRSGRISGHVTPVFADVEVREKEDTGLVRSLAETTLDAVADLFENERGDIATRTTLSGTLPSPDSGHLGGPPRPAEQRVRGIRCARVRASRRRRRRLRPRRLLPVVPKGARVLREGKQVAEPCRTPAATARGHAACRHARAAPGPKSTWSRSGRAGSQCIHSQECDWRWRGRRTANAVSVSSERASISPPCAFAISRAMYRPRPRLPSASSRCS